MTRNEIQALIDAKIKGQGTQIDLGNALPSILGAFAQQAKLSESANLKVVVHSYKRENDEWVADTDGSGKVIVKGFSETGAVLETQEVDFTTNEDGEAEVNVPVIIGSTIGVTAKITGKSTSCQFVQKVVGDSRIEPEIYPVGLYEIGDGSLNPSPSGDGYNGTAIVTEDFSIVWLPYQREGWKDDYLQFGGMFQNIPFVKNAQTAEEAITDFDGALNTAAILSVVNSKDSAAMVANEMPNPFYSRFGAFLPSAGMLKYLYDHKADINAFIAAEESEYGPDTPYETIPNDVYCWSSTIKEENDTAVKAWRVNFSYGSVGGNSRGSGNPVACVSAFQTLF